MLEDIRKASAQGFSKASKRAKNEDGEKNLDKQYEEMKDETDSLSDEIEDADLNFGGSRHSSRARLP